MAVLRLFAAARDAAGTGLISMSGPTVGALLEEARARFGADFGRVLDASQVWCNGEPTQLDRSLLETDEVAVLPPVSGGADEGRASRPARQTRPAAQGRPSASKRAAERRPAAKKATAKRQPAKTSTAKRPASKKAAAKRSTATRPSAARGVQRQPSPRAPVQDAADPAPSSQLAIWLGMAPPRRGARPPIAPGYVRGRRRYAVVYDLDGPRVRLGLAWFALILGSLVVERLVVGLPLLLVVYGGVAGLAAAQTANAWVQRGAGVDARLAATLAVSVSAAALLGARFVGLVVLLAVVVAVLDAWLHASRRSSVLADAGLTLQSALVPAAVAVGVSLSLRYEIGAAVTLLLLVSVFDMGDFLVGSGAASVIEGPLAGAAAIAVVTGIIAVLNAPPFGGVSAWAFGLGAAVLCPAGQVLASAILPDGLVRAPALRRLDSLLLLAPLWAWAIAVPLSQAR